MVWTPPCSALADRRRRRRPGFLIGAVKEARQAMAVLAVAFNGEGRLRLPRHDRRAVSGRVARGGQAGDAGEPITNSALPMLVKSSNISLNKADIQWMSVKGIKRVYDLRFHDGF
jgi:hypothetical protein